AAAAHLGPDPVARVAADFDQATAHLRPQVHASAAFNAQPAAGHFGAQHFDPAAIALDEDVLIVGIAFDIEELPERSRRVAVLHRQRGDFREAFAGELV